MKAESAFRGRIPCTVCGSPFDPSDGGAFVHPTLFGGVDAVCPACFKSQEEVRRKRMAYPANKIKVGALA